MRWRQVSAGRRASPRPPGAQQFCARKHSCHCLRFGAGRFLGLEESLGPGRGEWLRWHSGQGGQRCRGQYWWRPAACCLAGIGCAFTGGAGRHSSDRFGRWTGPGGGPWSSSGRRPAVVSPWAADHGRGFRLTLRHRRIRPRAARAGLRRCRPGGTGGKMPEILGESVRGARSIACWTYVLVTAGMSLAWIPCQMSADTTASLCTSSELNQHAAIPQPGGHSLRAEMSPRYRQSRWVARLCRSRMHVQVHRAGRRPAGATQPLGRRSHR